MFWKKSQKFLKTHREEPVLESFYFIVAAWNPYKTKTQSKSYSVNFIKKATPKQRRLHKYFSVNFEKIVNTTSNMLKKELVI